MLRRQHTAADSSGNGNSGTLSGSPTWVAAQVSGGLQFTSTTSDYVTVADAAELRPAEWTAAAWVKLDSLPASGQAAGFIAKQGSVGGYVQYSIAVDYNGTCATQPAIAVAWQSSGGSIGAACGSTSPSTGIWYHVTGTWDGTTLSLYIDGKLVDSNTPGITPAVGAYPVFFGGYLGTYLLDGTLDDARVYDRALSAGEVQTLYNATKSTLDSGLVGHWKLDETSGGAITDSSGNGNNGTWLDGDNDDVTEEAVSGMVDGALDFAGPNNYITIPDDPTLNPAADWTISAWFKDPVSDQWIVAKTPNPQTHRDYWMEVEWDDKFQCAYTNNNTTIAAKDSSIFNGGGNWHVGTCVYDEGQQELRAYLDGVLVATQATGGTEPVDTSANLGIGDEATLAGGAQDGQIDEVRIYNRTLSADEIAELAATTGPGDLRYNASYRVPEFYNGYGWVATGPIPDTSTGLVGHWKLDETSGTTAYDAAGSNDGTMQGGQDAGNDSVAGAVDTALDFNGSTDYIEIADADEFSFGDTVNDSPFTLSAWINMNDATEFEIVAKDAGGSTPEWDFYTYTDDTLTLQFYDANINNYIFKYADTPLTSYEGSWVHVVATYDGSGNASGIDLYVNGSALATTTGSAGSYTAMHNLNTDVEIGAYLESGSEIYSNGAIDDVRIYNRALSALDILGLYNLGRGEDVKDGLVGWWKLDETSGTTATDAAGTSDGTMMGGLDAGTDSAAGQIGTALTFDNSADYIDLNDPFEAVAGSQYKTLAGWAKAGNTTETDRILTIHRTNASSAASIFKTSTWGGGYRDTGDTWVLMDSGVAVTAGVWTHVALVQDGSDVTLYVNGVATTTANDAGAPGMSSPANAYIGDYIGGGELWDGELDDIRLYDRALSDSEIHNLYLFGLAGGAGSCTNPAGAEGDLLYNNSFNAMTYCNGRGGGWTSIGK